jgi:dTDP-4-amino-4,6-dideoxygalactose transaminase
MRATDASLATPMHTGFIAPAGTQIVWSDLASGFAAGFRGESAELALLAMLRGISERENAWIISSGRAAMVLVLQAMRDVAADPSRNEIIVPAYTCYSVAASIERAGLVPRLVDIDVRTLSPDLDALRSLPTDRVLGMVSANLYGLPNALSALEAFARERGIFMLDDSAQGLGARIAGRPVGGFGDAGLYSFDKGKNITTIQGGAIVAGAGPLGAAIAARCRVLPAAGAMTTLALALKLVAYTAVLRPRLYAGARRLLSGSLGITPYETDYPIARLGHSLCGIALRLGSRLPELAATRRANAARYSEALAGLPGLQLIEPLPAAEPAYVRFPLRVADPEDRTALIAALEADGIGATASYPRALVDVPEVMQRAVGLDSSFAGARLVARSIVTLPTHGYCPPDIATRVAGAVA